VDRHRADLRPPVCNKQVFEQGEFIIMVVGGPNARQDYHVDPGEEFFYQLEGDMLLKTVQDGKLVDIPSGQGEILLLPANVPHSPQRFSKPSASWSNASGARGADGFLWYCRR
jgi:3-hydroxyanthranilate 3,4-dioxygenase